MRLPTLLLAALVLGMAVAAPEPSLAQKPVPLAQSTPITVEARRLNSFYRGGGETQRFGRVEFRGGLVLSSPSREFGGWSGLIIDPDGRRMMAISDAGTWMTADIGYDGTHPVSINNARIGPIRGIGGVALTRARDRDSEDIALVDGSIAKGNMLIAFEHNHRIGRFTTTEAGLSPPFGYMKRAPEFSRLKPNVGIEAVTVLRGGPHKGAVVAFGEELRDAQGNHTGWIWPTGPGSDPQRLGVTDIGRFAVTGAASLPDGGLIILERYFRWVEGVKMRLRSVPAGEINAGALLSGEVLMEADMRYEIDNMEGLAVHRGARGEPIITVISDDNFNPLLQRTILLQFALNGPRTAAAPGK
jgi:hypothetical protein